MSRPTEARLRRAFADVLTSLLATAAGAVVLTGAVGCGGSGGTDITAGSSGSSGSSGVVPPPSPGFTSLCNSSGQTKSLLAAMKVDPPVDGAMYRTEQAFKVGTQGGQGGVVPSDIPDDWTSSNGEIVGKLCSKASNGSACLDKVDGLRVLPTTRAACLAQFPAASYGTDVCGATYIVYTRGDSIGVARNVAETKALIGEIDNVDEALWVATATTSVGYRVTCSSGSPTDFASEYRQTGDGGYDMTLAQGNCGEENFKVTVHVDRAGVVTVLSKESVGTPGPCAIAGRRPEGLRDRGAPRKTGGNAVGEHFAAMATLEAAAVTAFRRLARHLKSHGAPEELLARIRTAVRDEIRHARATTALARKFGVMPSAPEVAAQEQLPSLFELALENAREGCVRETFGALVAQVQVSRAADADVRATMAAIADEETEHAALSWDIAAWIESQLGEEDRARLLEERRDAFATLARELAAPVDAGVQEVSGVPCSTEALRMLESLEPTLLAA